MPARSRRSTAILLALLALVPSAAADDEGQAWFCADLDRSTYATLRDECDALAATATRVLSATQITSEDGANGEVGLAVPIPLGKVCQLVSGRSENLGCIITLESSEVEPVPLAPVGALARIVDVVASWGAQTAQQTPAVPVWVEDPPAWIAITVRYHARWVPARCDSAEGEAEATLQGDPVLVSLPPGFFGEVCALAQEHRDGAPDPRASARIAAAALAGVESAAIAPEIDAAVRALDAIAMPSTGAPSADPPETGAWADGESILRAAPTLGALDASQNASAQAGGIEANERAALAVEPSGPDAQTLPAASLERPAPPAPVAARADRREERATTRLPDAIPDGRAVGKPPPPVAGREVPGAAAARVHSVAAAEPLEDGSTRVAATVAALLALVGVALYQRFGKPKALAHPVREAAHRAILAAPEGATAADVARALGLDRKAVEYHLVYLARLGLLREVRALGERRRFASPATAKPSAPRECAASRVLSCVQGRPGISAADLADALGMTRMRADRYVKELLYLGRLESRMGEGGRRLYPAASR